MALSKSHQNQIDKMDDISLVEVWKVYFSKSKNFKKGSKENKHNLEIANYALKLHKKNLK